MALSWTLDKLGPMCRTAEDCGLVLAVIAGRDPLDPTTVSKPLNFPEAGKAKKYRIGVLRNANQGAMPSVRQNFEQSLKVLGKFCDIAEDVPFPDMPFSPAVGTIINAEGASAFRDLIESGRVQQLRSQMRWSSYAATTVLAIDYLQALRTRTKMKKTLDELYAKYDALVMPGRQTVAYPINEDFNQAYKQFGGGPPLIPAGNLAGQPALCLPNGFGPNNLPTAIQFTGRAWTEGRLLAIGHAYQEATDWHKRRPNL